jgi:hypothetical protein
MTTAADDSAVEDAFEALLAGRPVPEGAAGLAAFTGAVRASATRPGRPNAALAELLATGLLTDQPSPSAATARTAGSPPPRRSSRVRIRRRTAMIFPVLIAKFLAAGAVAQAATGAAVVVVAVTGVGAAGALPAPVQDTFSTVVAAVSPVEPATSEKTTVAESGETTGEVVPEGNLPETIPVTTSEETEDTQEDAEFDVAAWVKEGPDEDKPFGEWVSKGAHSDKLKADLRAAGLTFGKVVSAWANGDGLDEKDLAAFEVEGTEPTEPESVERVEDVPATDEAAAAATSEDRGSRGNGNGNGNGQGSEKSDGKGNGKGNGKN